MSKKKCFRDKEVQVCLKTKKISPELQKHISACPVCQDTALVYGWMNHFKENAWNTDMPKKTLPDADSIWNRVHARKRPDRELVQKALRPLIFPQVLFYGLFIAGIITTTIWGFKKFGNVLDNRVISQVLPFFGIMMIIVFISLSFCAIVVALDKRKHPV